MTLSTFTIGGEDYQAYASLAEADRELAVSPSRSAVWAALEGAAKMIHLVAATRRLDLLNWRGERAAGHSQATAWPRSGLTYPDGAAVGDTEIPAALVRATAYMAAAITGDAASDAPSTSQTPSPITRVKAGSAEVTFAEPTEVERSAIRPLPVEDEAVHALIGQWLVPPPMAAADSQGGILADTGGAGLGSQAYGTGARSQLSDEYERTEGFS